MKSRLLVVEDAAAIRLALSGLLKREGYVNGYEVHSDGPRSVIQIDLKYGPDGEDVITKIDRSALSRFGFPITPDPPFASCHPP